MLVLRRKLGEKILIPEADICISVVRLVGNQIEIGIEAPNTLTIVRQELIDGSERHTVHGRRGVDSRGEREVSSKSTDTDDRDIPKRKSSRNSLPPQRQKYGPKNNSCA